MRWRVLGVVAIILFSGAGLARLINQSPNLSNHKIKSMVLEGRQLTLLVADEPMAWATGLMNRRNLDKADGMIFIFPEAAPRTFWNKNTHLDLILYWLSGDQIIGTSSLPAIEKTGQIYSVSSPEAVDRVVEVVVQ